MQTLVNIWSALKSWFSVQNLKVILVVFLSAMIGFIVYQQYRINDLKGQVAAANEQSVINARNVQVLKDSAHYWKAKDSTSVVTVGLLSATNDTWKTQFSDLNDKFNNLIYQNGKGVQRQTYLETQIGVKDSMIAKLTHNPVTVGKDSGSYISGDSTLVINQVNKFDSRNFNSLTGTVQLHFDSTKLSSANVNFQQNFGIGVDMAIYRTAKGVPQVSVGTKYPNAQISVSGIQDVNDQIQAAVNKSKAKSAFGIGLQAGYGYTIVPGQPVGRGIYVGVGVGWQPNFLRFNKN